MPNSLAQLSQNIDIEALILSLVVFFVAAVVAWALRRFEVTDSTGLIVLILLPLVTYGVATGFIRKFSLPGGVSAEFREIANASVSANQVVEQDDLQVIGKEAVSQIRDKQKTIKAGDPVAISLILGRPNYYNQTAIAQYIRSFQTFDPNLTVIFLDADGSFAASSNGQSVLAAVEVEEFGRAFIDAIETRDLIALGRLVVMTDQFVEADTKNAEALEKMLASGVDHMVKIDTERRPVGIVRRDAIMSKLIVSLARE